MTLAILIGAGAFALGGCATRPSPKVEGLYEFGYHVTWQGTASARPVQVFDDGSKTYFQLKPGAPTPALFTADHGVMRPVYARRDGYYLVAPGVAKVWRVVGASGHGVVRGSPGSPSSPRYLSGPATANGPAAATISGGSARTGDRSIPQSSDSGAQGQISGPADNALPATLNGDVQSLVSQIKVLKKRIADEKAHSYVHSTRHQPTRDYSLVVPFAEGSASLNQTRAVELNRIANLAESATRVDLRAVSTPGGSKHANLALAHKRISAVRHALVQMGVEASSVHVATPNLNGSYPHVVVRFSTPNLQAIPRSAK
ncbi:MAG TPA: TrbG/VirB9 family P-type conjugative transfer protein [Gammaproteobacteria bacterium]|nr:TrbG/VirB9 family P-type conjugative transfer protein [Gammaproteobacteria bacterium]